MDLVKRYIAAVQRELPEPKRQEIGRELQANIMDQLDALAEQTGQDLTDQQVADVLKNMGHPTQVARQFCPTEPLIRAHLMPLYKHTLFMVLGVLFVLQVVFMTKAWLTGADFGLIRFILGLASGFIEDAVFGFTAITLGFALMPVNAAAGSSKTYDQWHPKQLPPVGAGWQHISLSDIFSDLATYAFLLLIIWLPLWQQNFAVTAAAQSVFSAHVLPLLMWFSPVIVLGVIGSLWQLSRRLWHTPLLRLNVLVNLAFTLMLLTLALSGPLLQLDTDNWVRHFDPNWLQRTIKFFVLSLALIPAYEVVRDLLRLKRLSVS
ncbi:MAG: hypothetical protein CML20_10635 [Rheinheimera sp.]|uniref:HAAS signaling domain-containing protein n=1 Tax=Arsukibacterium sp. UBA3155 TaxID=1946058 RepID=UPI000C977E9A|nr:hypothetical protein [Arsukibacterium sp. UBA3155]MAD75227.1 hypothetical protein [Rheinheimera sp.]|tara:strand:+ start:34656 stop:35615 length:960 start_codon:yes stop_codon:yes gene_type:complete